MTNDRYVGQDLRGQSFVNQDLSGANFTGCKLGGVNFSGANLIGVKFCNARFGQTLMVRFLIAGLDVGLGLLSGVFVGYGASFFQHFVFDALKLFAMQGPTNGLWRHMFSSQRMSDGVEILDPLLPSWLALLGAILICSYILLAVKRRRFDYFLWLLIPAAVAGISLRLGILPDPAPEGIRTLDTIGTSLILSLFGILGGVIAGLLTGILCRLGFLIATGTGLIFAVAAYSVTGLRIGEITIPIVGIVITFIMLGRYLGWLAINKELAQLTYIRQVALSLKNIFCTRFSFANLQGTDFSGADLRGCNFTHAIFRNCRFEGARNHHLALAFGSPLETQRVRELIVNKVLGNKDFSGLDLQGLDFLGQDLHGSNFANSNLSYANFSGCNLRETNLREVTALGACFNYVQLTGACIENWNIDKHTELKDIDCAFVYLRGGQEERNPPEGNFGAQEFSKLYQRVADTIDFIVHNRVELASLISAVESVKIHAGNEEIFVQDIERKEGSIIIRVKAPHSIDRDLIYKEVRKEQEKKFRQLKYEYEQREMRQLIEIGRQRAEVVVVRQSNDSLLNLLKDAVQRPTYSETNIMSQDHSRSISVGGNFHHNGNLNLGDHSALTNTIQQLPEQYSELKGLLQQLVQLIDSLPKSEQPEAREAVQNLAQAVSLQRQDEQESVVKKTVRYFKGLASDLTDLPDIAVKLGETVAKISLLYQ